MSDDTERLQAGWGDEVKMSEHRPPFRFTIGELLFALLAGALAGVLIGRGLVPVERSHFTTTISPGDERTGRGPAPGRNPPTHWRAPLTQPQYTKPQPGTCTDGALGPFPLRACAAE